jgi:phosphoribosylaminoimidazole carboxylase PurK protein
VTYEFENIDASAVEYLAAQVPVRPDPKALRICQDRVAEKRFVNSLNIKTAPFAPVANPAELREAVQKIGLPAVLKSNTLGYDGKGQVKITQDTDLDAAWRDVTRTGSASAVLEGFVEFEREVSVIVARGADGRDAAFPVVENEHRDHILYRTTVPARAGLSEAAQSNAVDIARRIAAGLNLVGVLAVEMFVVPRGNEVDILVNELAPRPHNSGHWTIEGSATSQFEQLVRAACGLPLGSIGKVARCEMTNLIGKEIEGWAEYVAQEGVHLHVYGKHEAREGRKMGHVTKIL